MMRKRFGTVKTERVVDKENRTKQYRSNAYSSLYDQFQVVCPQNLSAFPTKFKLKFFDSIKVAWTVLTVLRSCRRSSFPETAIKLSKSPLNSPFQTKCGVTRRKP